jgi:hypothetical protein
LKKQKWDRIFKSKKEIIEKYCSQRINIDSEEIQKNPIIVMKNLNGHILNCKLELISNKRIKMEGFFMKKKKLNEILETFQSDIKSKKNQKKEIEKEKENDPHLFTKEDYNFFMLGAVYQISSLKFVPTSQLEILSTLL